MTRPPKQKPTMPMLRVGEAGLVEVRERGVDVGEHAVVAHALEQRHHLGEVVVGAVPPPARWNSVGATAW